MAKDKNNNRRNKKIQRKIEEVRRKTPPSKTAKKKITSGVLHVEATFNNTKVLFSDKLGMHYFGVALDQWVFVEQKRELHLQLPKLVM